MGLKTVGVNLVVKGTGQFKTKMAGATSTVNKLGSTIARNNKAIGLGLTAIGAGILAVGVSSVRTYARMGDEVQKMAIKTGFSTEKLSELRFAAELSGASLASIEKGVKTMSSALVDAHDGLETYARSFRTLGIDVEKTLALKPEEQFTIITEALAEVENQTIKSALAQDIFGRAGLSLLPLLEQGAEGMRAMAQEARDLGLIFDQEAANAAALFNDNMTRLQGSVDGVKFAIANNLLPTLTPFIEKMTDSVKGIVEWTKENPALTTTLVAMAASVSALSIGLGTLIFILPTVTAGLAALGVTAGVALAAIAGLTLGIGLLVFGITGLINNAKARAAVDEIAIERTKALAGETNNLAEQLENALMKGYIEATPVILKFIADTKALTEAERLQAEQTKRAAEAIESEIDAMIRLAALKNKGESGAIADVFRSIGRTLMSVPGEDQAELFDALREEAFGPAGPLRQFRRQSAPDSGGGNVTNNFNIEATYTSPQDPATIALDLEALALESSR